MPLVYRVPGVRCLKISSLARVLSEMVLESSSLDKAAKALSVGANNVKVFVPGRRDCRLMVVSSPVARFNCDHVSIEKWDRDYCLKKNNATFCVACVGVHRVRARSTSLDHRSDSAFLR